MKTDMYLKNDEDIVLSFLFSDLIIDLAQKKDLLFHA